MDFQKFCEQSIDSFIKPEVLKQQETTLQEKIDSYKGKSEDELMQEFMKASKNMDLDNSKLQQVCDTLGPMLNEQQKEKLHNLLNQIRK